MKNVLKLATLALTLPFAAQAQLSPMADAEL